MKILFFNYEYPPLGGGAGHATAQIFKEFENLDDIQIDLITSSLNEEFSIEKVSDNISVHRIPIGKNDSNLHYQSQKELVLYLVRAFLYTRKIIRTKKYDMTHSFFSVPCGLLSLYCKWIYGINYVVSLRGADVPGYSERFTWIYKIFTPIIRIIWQQAQFCVTNSSGLTKLAQKSSKNTNFKEIYNGIDIDLFPPLKDKSNKIFTVLCAARLTYRKGFQYSLDALAILRKKNINVKMIIAGGDGGMHDKLQGQVQALGLESYVEFTGKYSKEDIASIYQHADVFLMPSFNEGMSNNVLEALASGVPIIMTPTGGSEESVKNGINGYIVEYMSSEKIAFYIDTMIKNPQLTKDMGTESHKIAQTLSWSKTAQEYHTLYKNMTES